MSIFYINCNTFLMIILKEKYEMFVSKKWVLVSLFSFF